MLETAITIGIYALVLDMTALAVAIIVWMFGGGNDGSD